MATSSLVKLLTQVGPDFRIGVINCLAQAHGRMTSAALRAARRSRPRRTVGGDRGPGEFSGILCRQANCRRCSYCLAARNPPHRKGPRAHGRDFSFCWPKAGCCGRLSVDFRATLRKDPGKSPHAAVWRSSRPNRADATWLTFLRRRGDWITMHWLSVETENTFKDLGSRSYCGVANAPCTTCTNRPHTGEDELTGKAGGCGDVQGSTHSMPRRHGVARQFLGGAGVACLSLLSGKFAAANDRTRHPDFCSSGGGLAKAKASLPRASAS